MRPRKALTAAKRARRRRAYPRCRSKLPARPPRRPPSSRAWRKCCVADDARLRAHAWRSRLAALIVALAGPYDAILAPSTTNAKNVMPRVGRAPRRDADFRHHQSRSRPTLSSARSMPATPSRLFARSIRRKSSPCAPPRSSDRRRAAPRRSSRRPPPPIPACPASSAKNFPNPTARTRPRPRSSSPAAGRCKAGEFHEIHRAGRRQTWRRGRRFARGGRCRLCAERLAGRADRQGRGAGALYRCRHFRRDPASGRHEGIRKSSSLSTRTRKRRSSKSPTMGLWQTFTRPCRNWQELENSCKCAVVDGRGQAPRKR